MCMERRGKVAERNRECRESSEQTEMLNHENFEAEERSSMQRRNHVEIGWWEGERAERAEEGRK